MLSSKFECKELENVLNKAQESKEPIIKENLSSKCVAEGMGANMLRTIMGII